LGLTSSLKYLQLKEANESLGSKSETVGELEGQILSLKASLETAQTDIQSKQAVLDQLEQTSGHSETELAEAKAALQKLKEENASVLFDVQEQVMSTTLDTCGLFIVFIFVARYCQRIRNHANRAHSESPGTNSNIGSGSESYKGKR
jgi:hypothetical protein